MRLEKGEIIGGRFSLVRMVGEGGMGWVWAALDARTNELVALKVLRREVKAPEIVRRFLREARAAMAVRHPNVVRIREVITIDDEPVIVMDFLEGESLRTRLERVERVPLGAFAEMFVSVLSAIGTAHAAGVVHRDLKPDNIFLLRLPGGREEPRVVDFGIAKLTAIHGDAQQSGHLTTTGAVLGTPYYMSPEQVFGDKHIDHRTDVWSLGTIAFESLSGQRPVEGDNIGQILKVITTGGIPRLEDVAPQLPSEICELVGRMLSYDRAKRPSDLREVLDVFQRHTSHTVQSFGGATLVMSGSGAQAGPTDDVAPSPFAATLATDTPMPGVVPSSPAASGGGFGSTTAGLGLSASDAGDPVTATNTRARLIAMIAAGLVAVSGASVLGARSFLRTPSTAPALSATSGVVASPALVTPSPELPPLSSSSPAEAASPPIEAPIAVASSKPVASRPVVTARDKPIAPIVSAAPSASAARPPKTAPIASDNPYE